tara:strand:- start:175 stop:459 length:285 start_codon:yes stop_codon:yes gene_type:complete
MANTRAKVLGATFTMLSITSVIQIFNQRAVDANAWALLALSGVFAAATAVAYSRESPLHKRANESTYSENPEQYDTTIQELPDPADSGFDIPVV